MNDKNEIKKNIVPIEGRFYKKSNSLIEGMYHSSLLENKILALGMAKAKLEEGRMVARITAGELKDLLCTDGSRNSGSFYARLKSAAVEMTGRRIFIEDTDHRMFSIINLIGNATYTGGQFTIKFEPDLTDYLLNLKANYTTLSLPILLSFDNVFAYRLYELLKSRAYGNSIYGDTYYISYGISELKLLLGVVDTNAEAVSKALKKPYPDFDRVVNVVSKENNYGEWRDFRRRIIDKAVNEINEKSDLSVSYTVTREGYGGKVNRITFQYQKKDINHYAQNKTDMPSEDEIMDMIDTLISSFDEPLKVKDARTLLDAAGYNIQPILNAYELASTQENIENLVGWLLAAIKKNYVSD